ncbi:tetrahydromethanopterin S-methyltransferase subunit E [Paenibacillus baekrokdamisoli]|nr:tetrahydromethanopterin S-methyltransferase subunit E [Paenibacillus baekrokdamisoli]
MSIIPSLVFTLPIVLLIVFLANWFALWFKPLNIVLLGIQLSITGIFMLLLWLVLNHNVDEHHYGALAYFAVVISILGLLLSCSFALRRH